MVEEFSDGAAQWRSAMMELHDGGVQWWSCMLEKFDDGAAQWSCMMDGWRSSMMELHHPFKHGLPSALARSRRFPQSPQRMVAALE